MRYPRIVPIVVVGLVLSASLSWAQAFVYHRDIGGSITFAWTHDKACPQVDSNNQPAPSSFYQFEFRGIKEGTTEIKLQGQTPDLQVPIQASFDGQLFYEVREVCLRGTTYLYSPYASSKDPAVATVDGVARGWLVSYDIRPPAEVLISKP